MQLTNKEELQMCLEYLNNDNKMVGMINIRLNLKENLKKLEDILVYSIRPTERRKGYKKIIFGIVILQLVKKIKE